MGKGDRKTAKGKRYNSSYGNARSKAVTKAAGTAAAPAVKKAAKTAAAKAPAKKVVAKKAVKPNPMTGVTGGIVDKTMPIHQSNVAIFNAVSGKADRVGIKLLDDGKKVRVAVSSGKTIH